MALVGTISLRINNRPAVTVTDFNYDHDTPTQNHAGGYGPIDTAQGVGTGTFSFKARARQETGLEFNPLTDLAGSENVIVFPVGSMRFALLGAAVNKHSMSVQQQQGNTEFSVSGTYRQFKQTR